jgi:hypothetical protein
VRVVALSVKLPCAFALSSGLPSHLREPLRASDTVLEATAPVKLPTSHRPRCTGEGQSDRRVVFHQRLRCSRKSSLSGSHLSYASAALTRWQAVVKLHGVFLSCYGLTVSSPSLQFHRALGRDSAQIVMPFVRVGTYPTRNFATLGPL